MVHPLALAFTVDERDAQFNPLYIMPGFCDWLQLENETLRLYPTSVSHMQRVSSDELCASCRQYRSMDIPGWDLCEHASEAYSYEPKFLL